MGHDMRRTWMPLKDIAVYSLSSTSLNYLLTRLTFEGTWRRFAGGEFAHQSTLIFLNATWLPFVVDHATLKFNYGLFCWDVRKNLMRRRIKVSNNCREKKSWKKSSNKSLISFLGQWVKSALRRQKLVRILLIIYYLMDIFKASYES